LFMSSRFQIPTAFRKDFTQAVILNLLFNHIDKPKDRLQTGLCWPTSWTRRPKLKQLSKLTNHSLRPLCNPRLKRQQGDGRLWFMY
jgi:hypothetical protein